MSKINYFIYCCDYSCDNLSDLEYAIWIPNVRVVDSRVFCCENNQEVFPKDIIIVNYKGNFISIDIAVSEAFNYFKSDMINRNCSNYGKRINIRSYILDKPVCAHYIHYRADYFYFNKSFLLKCSYQDRAKELFKINKEDAQFLLDEILDVQENRYLKNEIFNIPLEIVTNDFSFADNYF